MSNKVKKYIYKGMMQDTSNAEFSNEYYFEGKNIRIVATDTQSSNSITNEKGNSLVLTIPVPIINYNLKTINYNNKVLKYKTVEIDSLFTLTNQNKDQEIISHVVTRDSIVLFTTNNFGLDCIWKVDFDTYNITLLYLRNLGFNVNTQIQILNNFENEKIDKIYWVDGRQQLKFLNLNHSINNQDLEELIDLPINVVSSTGSYNLTQPVISNILVGGVHTSGMIQYAYNLYRLNSSQTKISPLSKLISLDKGLAGGGLLNEIVNSIPVIDITNLDSDYTNIRVYAIKYTSFNEVPSISLINDSQISNTRSVQIFDDGKVLSNVSLENFLFLGSDIVIPKHIASKYNTLFYANYKEKVFEVNLDCRSYLFKSDSTCLVYNNIRLNNNNIEPVNPVTDVRVISNSTFTDDYLDTFNSINLNYDSYKFQSDGLTNGGEGKYIKYELTQSLIFNDDNKYLKDEEIYRLGITFFNSYSQTTKPIWIADFKSRSGNLQGKFNTLKVTLKPEFYTWLNTNNFDSIYDKPVGYKIVLADRTFSDKTIVNSGLLSTMMLNYKQTIPDRQYDISYNTTKSLPKIPNLLIRNCNSYDQFSYTKPLRKCKNHAPLVEKFDGPSPINEVAVADLNTKIEENGNGDFKNTFFQFNSMLQMYSPEILFNKNSSVKSASRLKIKGFLKNSYNASWSREQDVDGTVIVENKAFNGLSPSYSESRQRIAGGEFDNLDTGILAHPGGSEPNTVEINSFYRVYGNPKVPVNKINQNLLLVSNNLNTVTNSLGTIKKVNNNYGVENRLTNFIFGDYSTISYTINPILLNITTLYNIEICRNIDGSNVISSLSNVSGVNTITLTSNDLFTIGIDNFNYYLFITPVTNVLFRAKIDLLSKIVGSQNTTKNSINNEFLIDTQNNFVNNFISTPLNNKFSIYGKPEITEKGQDFINYNSDSNYRYTNSLTSCYTDENLQYNKRGFYNRAIVSVNVYNNKCVTLVTGPANVLTPNDNLVNAEDRNQLEDLFNSFNLPSDANGIYGELVISDEEIYLGNIYGGNSFESKKRTNYLEIGNYSDINNSTINISSPGDTFVGNFKFLRLSRGDANIIEQGTKQYEEILEFTTETTIDLKNRTDLSKNIWDSQLIYKNDDYHKYNEVYSQQANLNISKDTAYNFKKSKNFDTKIIASKKKVAGEIIDSWTDLLVNETLTLDGKYGEINSLHNFKDEIYAIQDSAISFISINPRVQIQGSDGIAVQLGTGSVLDQYKYLNTFTGTKNKYSLINSLNSFYFYDTLNNNLQVCNGQSVEELSDVKGLHSYFTKNNNKQLLISDNTNIFKGVTCGYDNLNNELLFTFLQDNKSFTLSYNETTKTFVSFYDYLPSRYITQGSKFYAVNSNKKNQLFKQYEGNYNQFFGMYYPSSITFNVNPEYDVDCVFDNINFKSEVSLNNIDQPDVTLTNIKAYSDYQNSELVPLTLGRNNNLRRKFRDWNALIPRQHLKRERIRGNYIKLQLQFKNELNYKLILHPINIFYTT